MFITLYNIFFLILQ